MSTAVASVESYRVTLRQKILSRTALPLNLQVEDFYAKFCFKILIYLNWSILLEFGTIFLVSALSQVCILSLGSRFAADLSLNATVPYLLLCESIVVH